MTLLDHKFKAHLNCYRSVMDITYVKKRKNVSITVLTMLWIKYNQIKLTGRKKVYLR